MESMIIYDGIPLESVANVKVEDVRVSPIHYNPVVRERAGRMGSNFVRMLGSERTVTISFAVLDRNPIQRRAALLALSQWAKTDAEHQLEVPGDATRCLFGVCTSKPEASTRQWFENKLKIVFTCFNNPFWTSKVEKSVACGTQFNAFGDAPPLVQIRATLANAASNVLFSNGVESMAFTEIPAGNMVIDLNNQTAAVGTTSFMSAYQITGQFLKPRPGVQTITGTGTVYFRERWE